MNSILNQKKHYFDTRVILLDSGSTDKTKEIFFSYKDNLNLQFKNIGKSSIGEARNYAITEFIADYLIFLDSDDALTSDRLYEDYLIINSRQEIDFIYGDAFQIDKNSIQNSYYIKSCSEAGKYQFLNMPFNLSCTTISRDFLLGNKIYFINGRKGRLGEDWRFINEINLKGNYLYKSIPRVIINSRGDSHTQDYLKCDLNITKIEFICFQFREISSGKHFLKSCYFSFQVQASFCLSLVNIIKYTNPRKINFLISSFKKILNMYLSISPIYLLINLIFFPISIYLILFVHRRSSTSVQRSKLDDFIYKQICKKLS